MGSNTRGRWRRLRRNMGRRMGQRCRIRPKNTPPATPTKTNRSTHKWWAMPAQKQRSKCNSLGCVKHLVANLSATSLDLLFCVALQATDFPTMFSRVRRRPPVLPCGRRWRFMFRPTVLHGRRRRHKFRPNPGPAAEFCAGDHLFDQFSARVTPAIDVRGLLLACLRRSRRSKLKLRAGRPRLRCECSACRMSAKVGPASAICKVV